MRNLRWVVSISACVVPAVVPSVVARICMTRPPCAEESAGKLNAPADQVFWMPGPPEPVRIDQPWEARAESVGPV
ncbi:hypothetical protein [Actinacidiphila acididurans]|uniref:hypothetical protein n=1 Tax=Actinacidiphila acididurans TaxID=2784346 RepID=UPI001F255523|nr:hypothetical protein [Actinacidiphila acididurans]